jgi:hypothetical protein
MASLSVQDVAHQAAVSDRTVRRWLASGKLAGTLTADGWTVEASDLASFLANRSDRPTGPDGQVAGSDGHLAVLVGHVRDLERQLLDAAAAAAMYQERCRMLEAQVEQLRALPAPDVPQDAPQRGSGGPTPEPVREPAAARKRPWWRVW